MKKALPLFIFLLATTTTFFLIQHNNNNASKQVSKQAIPKFDKAWKVGTGIGTKQDRIARFNFEYSQLVDPATGKIPANMRDKELMFAKTLDNGSLSRTASSIEWENRGPFDVGGRTRAFAIDVTDENVMLAGSVSGGVWKSVDGGASWYKVNTSGLNLSVTTITQDPRPGHTHEWYYGTGELWGASHSAPGAFYLGNGVYKSTDNGENWEPISNTTNTTPQSFDDIWEGVWRIVIDPSNMAQTEIYVATISTIFRSVNGGGNWTPVLTSPLSGDLSYFTDVVISSGGVAYAGMSSENELVSWGLSPIGGIWRSEDGTNWTDITADSFPPTFNRIVLGFNPSNEDEVYVLASNVDTLFGKSGTTPIQDPEHNAFWRYNYNSGDGTGTGGSWTELTDNLYVGPYDFDDFYPQGGYNLMVSVHPVDPNIVFIGATNIYRSTDGFTTPDNVTQIGGYAIGTEWPLVESYPNHHSDQHGVTFLPSNPNVMLSYSDGGVARTEDCTAESVSWTSLNNGYISTQFYTLTIDYANENETLLGGLQDNGTRFTNNSDPNAAWTHSFGGDGAYCAIPDHGNYILASTQSGRLAKVQIDAAGEMVSFERFDPALERDEFRFIHPFTIDPNDNQIIYYPIRNKLYFTTDTDQYPFTNSFDSTMVGWQVLADTLTTDDIEFTAIAATETPEERIYLGTNLGRVYRVDNPTNIASSVADLTSSILPSDANVSGIAVDPLDGDELLLVFSNYNIYSIFHSTNAGLSWSKVAGNLEQNSAGTGNGSSIRQAEIMALPDGSRKYFVGTSVGLFSTETLDGINTTWTKESEDQIDNNIVTTIAGRDSDGFVAVATHGNGIYSGYVVSDSLTQTKAPATANVAVKLFPNPADDILNIVFDLGKQETVRLQLFDVLGRKVKQGILLNNTVIGENQFEMNVHDLEVGNYYLEVRGESFRKTLSIVVK